jgi:hypothetical protein
MRRAAGAFASVLLAAGSARAEPPVDLTWNAPPGCPTRAAVVAEIERLLSSEPVSGPKVVVTANVGNEVAGASSVWRVHIFVEGTSDIRVLNAPTCGTLAGATALVVAMMIAPLAVEATAPADLGTAPVPAPLPPPAVAPAPPAPAPPAPPPPVPPPIWQPPPPPVEEEGEPLAIVAGVRTTGAVGVLPGPAAGFGVDFGLLYGPARLDIGVLYYAERRAVLEERPDVGGDIDLVTAVATASWLPMRDPIELGPQLGLQFGSITGNGFGVRDPDSGSSAWVTPFVGGIAAWAPAPWLGVRLNVAVGWAGIRPSFGVTGVGTVHEVDGPVGELSLGAEVRFR